MAKTPANGNLSGGNNSNNTWAGVLIALIGALGAAYAVYMNKPVPPAPAPPPVIVQPATPPKTIPGTQTPPNGRTSGKPKPPIEHPPGTGSTDTGSGVTVIKDPPHGNDGGTLPPPPQTFPTLVLQQFDADHDGFAGHTEWRFVVSVNGIEVGRIAQIQLHNLPHHGTVNEPGWVAWRNVRLQGASSYKIDVQAYRPNEDAPRTAEHGSGTIPGVNGATAVHIKGGGLLAPYDFTLTFTVVAAP